MENINILIINAHWDNRGDEAAIRAMLQSLEENFPIKKIKIMILSESANYFPDNNVFLLKPFLYENGNLATILIDIFLIIVTFGKFAYSKVGKEYINSVNEADLVIHAPGGPMIGDLYSNNLSRSEFYYLFRLLIPLMKKKNVFFYAPSMGPFTGKIRNFFRKIILNKINPIIVRDNLSKEFLERDLSLDSVVTLDSAFQNHIPQTYIKRYDDLDDLINLIENKRVVGMTITDLKWHPAYNNAEIKDSIIKALKGSILELIHKNYSILFIPQLFGSQKMFEMPLLKEMQEIDPKRIYILPQDVDSYGQQLIISRLYCVIGMRYHPNIFAAKYTVPSIAISYEHKTDGFMKELGREDLVIDINNLTHDIIIQKFEYLEKNYDLIKGEINKTTPKLVNKSKKTVKLIKLALNQFSD